VLYTVEALKPFVNSGHRVYASLYQDAEVRLRDYAPTAGWSVTRIWTSPYAHSAVLLIVAQPSAIPAP
jgi:hypothetical protein